MSLAKPDVKVLAWEFLLALARREDMKLGLKDETIELAHRYAEAYIARYYGEES